MASSLELGLQRVLNNSSQEKHLFLKVKRASLLRLYVTLKSSQIRRPIYDSPIVDLMEHLLNLRICGCIPMNFS